MTSRKPLRLWPGVVLAILLVLFRFGLPLIESEITLFGFPIGLVGMLLGNVFCALAIVVWWVLVSRARWFERVGAVILMIVALFVTRQIAHESITGAGQGMLLYISAIPGLSVALVAWAAATRRLTDRVRLAALVGAIVLASAPWALVRTAGIKGGTGSEFHWRWTPTPEERLLAQARNEAIDTVPSTPAAPRPIPSPPPAVESPRSGSAKKPVDAAPTPAAPPATGDKHAPPKSNADPTIAADDDEGAPTRARVEWPGFRGPNRDGVIPGVEIETNWTSSPPAELWRRPIGPGWSSFAVRGDVLYTQEQRADDEIVAAYKLSTGEPVWRHRDPVRFYESNGGAGPRGTPTIHGHRVYAFGATGILNALDADTGKVVWSRNVASDTGRRVPDWGFASSPLVIDDIVIVAAAGTLAAYDLASGNPRWRGPSYGGSYSSPHPATIDGVTQILQLGGPGAISVDPATGAVLWKYAWEPGQIVQPAVLPDGDILINSIAMTGGLGIRRLSVKRGPSGWNLEERWTSTGLKPYYNDFVVHKGHAYGFDGNILACVDLADGKRKWKGGRYGNGQLVSLPDQDLLLVISEEGELALVSATPDKFTEIARFKALDAKTWNHPVLVRDTLLVRNGEEMAAFRLSPSVY